MTSAADPSIPKPIPYPDDPLTAPFWAAARENRLAIQHCNDCGRAYHPPVGLCPICASAHLEMRDMSGKGRLYSYTVVHSQRVPAFDALTPFLIGRVELDDAPGLFMVTNLESGAFANDRVEPTVGDAVEIWFEEIAEGVKLPQFRLSPPIGQGGPL